MFEKYRPFLLGVSHSKEMLWDVFQEIDKVKPKSIGIEESKWSVENWRQIGLNPHHAGFWRVLIRECRARGIEITYLTPDRVAQQNIREQLRLKKLGITAQKVLENPQGHTEGKELLRHMRDKTTDVVEMTARKRRPQMLVLGLFHSAILRKNLGIPKARFSVHVVPSPRAIREMGVRVPRRKLEARKKQLIEGMLFHVKGYRRAARKR
ncbi:MAG: hypothetical protein V1776_03130 [Candidatus Diapherotrites archaeon]